MKTTEITFKVTVDENQLPLKIEWDAPDSGEKSECKSVMVALWDAKENNTLRIDLWTKEMTVDEMKKFLTEEVYPKGKMKAEFTNIELRDRFKALS